MKWKSYTYTKKLHTLNTVGYTELFDFIEDKLTLQQAVDLIKQNTRNYAKRQMTWFKKDNGMQWYQPQQKDEVVTYIDKKLSA